MKKKGIDLLNHLMEADVEVAPLLQMLVMVGIVLTALRIIKGMDHMGPISEILHL